MITALSDAYLPGLKAIVPEDTWIEVKPFGEVVRAIHEIAGEVTLPIAPTAHYHCAIAAACETLREDSPFFGVRTFRGFHESVAEITKELAMWGVDSDAAERLATEFSGRLSLKLRDLASISRKAKEWLKELGRELHSDHLAHSLGGTPERDGSLDRLLVFIGTEVSPLRMQWLVWLAQSGVEITAVFERDGANGGLFAGARVAASMLGVEPIQVGQGNRLQSSLFSLQTAEGPTLDDGVLQVCAPDVMYEVENALRTARRYGPLDRTAILCRDLDQYGPLLESASRRLEVPIVMVRREPLLANSFARLTMAALEFCGSSDVRNLLPISRSSYLGMNASERQLLNGVVREAHRARHQSWAHLDSWARQNQEMVPWLIALLDWRAEVQMLQVRFAEWCSHFRTFIGQLPWADNRPEGSSIETRDVYAQSALLRTLGSFASIDQLASDEPMGLHRFTHLARGLFEGADVSVPRAESGVFISAQADSLPAVDQLIVLGLLEGTFPKRRTEEAIFADEERAEISRHLPELPPLRNSFDRSAEERDEFYRVCSAARRRLVLSYPLAGETTDNVPAFYLGEVSRVVPEAESQLLSREDLAPETENCVSEADRRLRLALASPHKPSLPANLVTEEARMAICVRPDEPLTPEQLSDAARCPFAFSARHRLHIRSGRARARWSALRTLPQKAMLAIQPNIDQARFALEQALASQLDDLYAEIPAWELRLLETGGKRLIDEWLAKEAKMRATFPRQDLRVNVPFSAEGLRAELPGNLRLTGNVPAVSRFGDYRVLHLYHASLTDIKSLSKQEEYLEVDEIDQSLRATRLLIGLYLWSAYHAQICPALEIDTGTEKRMIVMQQRPLGPAPFPADAPIEIESLSPSRTGDWKESQVAFTQTTRALVKPVLQEVRTGTMRAIPHESSCRNCEFGELCRQSTEFGESIKEASTDAQS
jgi:hypothetical protein